MASHVLDQSLNSLVAYFISFDIKYYPDLRTHQHNLLVRDVDLLIPLHQLHGLTLDHMFLLEHVSEHRRKGSAFQLSFM